jgi:purine-binding chemotaxis protein CheW
MRMEHQNADHVELLVFELAGNRYALELRAVREVLRAVMIAPLPDAPDVVEGIIDLRGQLIPVFDLRARFGLRPRPLDPSERLVVAWTGSRVVAFRCERTEWVEHVEPSLIASDVEGTGRHIAGIARLPEGLVLIQDLEAFLDEAEAGELDVALDAQAARGAE